MTIGEDETTIIQSKIFVDNNKDNVIQEEDFFLVIKRIIAPFNSFKSKYKKKCSKGA